jgi:hypothetical protein
MLPETNGVQVRIGRVTMLPPEPEPHPVGQGACELESPCGGCAAAYAIEDEQRDTRS